MFFLNKGSIRKPFGHISLQFHFILFLLSICIASFCVWCSVFTKWITFKMSEVDPTQHLHKSHDRLQVKIFVMTILMVVFFILNAKHYCHYTNPSPPPTPHCQGKRKRNKTLLTACSLFPFQICYTKCGFKILIKKKKVLKWFYMKSNTWIWLFT